MNERGLVQQTEISVQTGTVSLDGTLAIPDGAIAIVVFAHGGGSNRFSSRNRFVADRLHDAGLATLLFDLLTPEEFRMDDRTHRLRFDIGLLGLRLSGTIEWLWDHPVVQDMHIGLFGGSTGAAAAMITAAEHPEAIGAVVSRGGRPDLAADALPYVCAPSLLIVGALDTPVLELNQYASRLLHAEHRLEIIPGASHLFEEPGTLEQASRLACDWFIEHLATSPHPRCDQA
jgi:putative phosphoribosyl transferase